MKPDDVATLIYTSGTTGNPKGVVLTHDNMDFEIGEVHKLVRFNQGEGYVSWLPCAHVFGQLADNHIWIRDAIHMRVVDNPLHSIDYCKEVNPHLFIGVPRIYEKVYSNLVAGLGSKVGWLKLPILGNIVRKKAKQKIGFSESQVCYYWCGPYQP